MSNLIPCPQCQYLVEPGAVCPWVTMHGTEIVVSPPPDGPVALTPRVDLVPLAPKQEHPVMESTSPTGNPLLPQLLVRGLVLLGTVALVVKNATAPHTVAHQVSAVVVEALVVAGLMSQGARKPAA